MDHLVEIAVIGAIVLIIGGALFYIIRAKRSGKKCIGCPDASTCSGNCEHCKGCSCKRDGE